MLSPNEIFDHDLLIERNIPAIRAWMNAIMEALLDQEIPADAICEKIKKISERRGLRLRMAGADGRRNFHLCDHGLTKEILSFNPNEDERIILARTMRGSIEMIDGERAVADLRASGYAEQAFCTEMQGWGGRRVVAYEQLALNLLRHVHPDDMEKALLGGYVPQVRSKAMQDSVDIIHNDRLAIHLETNDLQLATPLSSDHPNGTLFIKKRMGMVHVGPYNVEGVMFLGNHVYLGERRPESFLTALAGKPLATAVDMPMPFQEVSIVSAFNRQDGVQIETNGYVEAIDNARSYPWQTTTNDKSTAQQDALEEQKALRFGYTNWRGEYAIREAIPLGIEWGSTDWHPQEGWLMRAWDAKKGAMRQFALKDCDFTAAD